MSDKEDINGRVRWFTVTRTCAVQECIEIKELEPNWIVFEYVNTFHVVSMIPTCITYCEYNQLQVMETKLLVD